MIRSPSSDPSATPLPSLPRKRLFRRVSNSLSANDKPVPPLHTNPPPVVRLPPSENRKSRVRAIRTKFQSARTPLKLLRRLSGSNGRVKPRVSHQDVPLSSNPGRGRGSSLQLSRPPSCVRSRSAPDAASPSPSSTLLSMSDGASHSSATESTLLHDIHVPIDLQNGFAMTKVSAKESKKVTLKIDADLGQIFYQSKRTRISESLSLLSQSRIASRSPPFSLPLHPR